MPTSDVIRRDDARDARQAEAFDRRAAATKFKLVPFDSIRFVASDEWLIKKLVPRQGVAVIFGSPRSFKSFIAMDLALHVAIGWNWAGQATTQGDVVYIAAENVKGMHKREVGFEAANDANLPGRVPFWPQTLAQRSMISMRWSRLLKPWASLRLCAVRLLPVVAVTHRTPLSGVLRKHNQWL